MLEADAMLEIDELHVHYGQLAAVRGVSLMYSNCLQSI